MPDLTQFYPSLHHWDTVQTRDTTDCTLWLVMMQQTWERWSFCLLSEVSSYCKIFCLKSEELFPGFWIISRQVFQERKELWRWIRRWWGSSCFSCFKYGNFSRWHQDVLTVRITEIRMRCQEQLQFGMLITWRQTRRCGQIFPTISHLNLPSDPGDIIKN